MNIRIATLIGFGLLLGACSHTPATRSVAATSACSQIPDDEATAATLLQPDVAYGARRVDVKTYNSRAIQPVETVGAEVYLHARPGMTRQYVQPVLACHAAAGSANHPSDPLHPSQGHVTDLSVRSAGDSLAVRIVSDDRATGEEIFQRARSLTSARGVVTVEQVGAAPSSHGASF